MMRGPLSTVLIPNSKPLSEAEADLLECLVPTLQSSRARWGLERVPEFGGSFGITFDSGIEPEVERLLSLGGFNHQKINDVESNRRGNDGSPWKTILIPNERIEPDLTQEQRQVLFAWKASVAGLEAALILEDLRANENLITWYCVSAMLRAAYRFTDSDLGATVMSYYSHAQAYLSIQNSAVLRCWEQYLEENRNKLLKICRKTAVADETSVGGRLEAILAETWRAAADLSQILERTLSFGEVAKTSAFHHQLKSDESWRRVVGGSEWFWRYRASTNLLYLHLRHVGLSDYQRFFLCFLVSEVSFEFLGRGPEDIMGKLHRNMEL